MKEICYYCFSEKEAGVPCPHCGRAQPVQNEVHQLSAGTVLHGQYVIGRVLGQGGFGITYLAMDQNLKMQVAIKEYYPSSFSNRSQGNQVTATVAENVFQSGLRRFCKEAQLLAKLQDIPEIVHVLNFFEENGTAYMVMEFLQGRDLGEYLKSVGGKLTPEETLVLLRPILKALERVHELGLIHRDISPDNIMLTNRGTVKLLDFGIAKDLSGEGTKSTSIALKHGYAPMEQYRTNGNIGPWTDEYALCATAYFCMTGILPPEAPDRLMDGTDIDWESIPGMEPQWAQALKKGFSTHPDGRFSTLRELRTALEAPSAPVLDSHRKQTAVESPPAIDDRPVPQKEVDASNDAVPKPLEPPKEDSHEKKHSKETRIEIAIICCFLLLIAVASFFNVHIWKASTCTKPEVCMICGKTKGDALDHTWADANCNEPSKCIVCGQESGTPVHMWLPATCTEPSKCSNCGQLGTAIALGHSWEAATCSKPSKCERCGQLGSDNALGHTWTPASGNEPAKCSVCGEPWMNILRHTTIAGGFDFTAVIKSNGQVIGTCSRINDPASFRKWTDIESISGDYWNVACLRSDGTVSAIGDNNYGQCDVNTWEDIIAVSADYDHTVGLKSDGTVVATGENLIGQCRVGDWSDIVSIDTGINHTFGIHSDGTVIATGDNSAGQCDAVSAWTDIIDISAFYHILGLKSDGTVIAVGPNNAGEYNVSDWTDIVAVAAGHDLSLGLKSDGTVVATGVNDDGQCNVSEWRDIIAIFASNNHAIGLKADGTLVSTGSNNAGKCNVSYMNDILLP